MKFRIPTIILSVIKNLFLLLSRLFHFKTNPPSVETNDTSQIFKDIVNSNCSPRLKSIIAYFIIDIQKRQNVFSTDQHQEITKYTSSESYREDADKSKYYKEFTSSLSRHIKLIQESTNQLCIELQTIAHREDSTAIEQVTSAYTKCNNAINLHMKHFHDYMATYWRKI